MLKELPQKSFIKVNSPSHLNRLIVFLQETDWRVVIKKSTPLQVLRLWGVPYYRRILTECNPSGRCIRAGGLKLHSERRKYIDRLPQMVLIAGWRTRLVLSALDFVSLKNIPPLPLQVEIVNVRNPIARQYNVLKVCFLFYLFPLSSGEVQEINIANFMNVFMDIQF